MMARQKTDSPNLFQKTTALDGSGNATGPVTNIGTSNSSALAGNTNAFTTPLHFPKRRHKYDPLHPCLRGQEHRRKRLHHRIK